jgi:beta-phosphoglucomutase-like phosphatase (HAD superfamily)
MVERGKPAPDLFLLAASTMGAASEGCLVIEDSTAGVQAAKAAGMNVVGLVAGGHARPHLGDRLLAAGASRVFERVDQLADFVDAMPAGTSRR